MTEIEFDILNASHFKASKDLAKLYPVTHPKRVVLMEVINELQTKLNNKDLILQALNFGVSIVAPTNEYLFMSFPTMGFCKMFLDRIDKLSINYKYEFIDDFNDEIIIKVI